MKNIFKLLGIAILACGMMTACGGDDPKPENNDNNGGNGGNTEDNTTSVKVVFNGADQGTMGFIQGIHSATYGVTAFDFFSNSQAHNGGHPGVEIYTTLTAPGNGSATLGSNNSLDGEPAICEFYEQYTLTDEQNNPYGDWWAETASINLTKYDATNGVASFTVEANMFNAYEALVPAGGQVGVEGASRAAMTVTAKNISFTEQ